MGQDVLAAVDLGREWLLTNGAGGSALGTAAGPPARREHAWLHAADEAGAVTTVLIGCDERLHAEGGAYDLSPLTLRDAEDPALPAEVEAFTPDPWPTWRLRCGELVLERSLVMIRGHQAVAVWYRHVGGPAGRLRLGPRVVARDPGGLQRETPDLQGVAHGIPGRVRIETLPGRPTLTLWHNGAFMPARLWRRGIEYPGEARAGAEGREDAFIPGVAECPLSPSQSPHLVIATEEGLFRSLAIEGRLGSPPPGTLSECVAALAHAERARHRAFIASLLVGADGTARQAAEAHGDPDAAGRERALLEARDPWSARLARAVDHGLATRNGRGTLLTGFPDARERGEEALRGVASLIATRSFDVAREVLSGYFDFLDDGMAPAGFDGAHGTPRYDDPAPSLWLLDAAERLARRSEDLEWARGCFPQAESVVQHFRAGNRYGVRVDGDGLLAAGDARAKPAALNALWFHGLVAMSQMARAVGRKESAAFYLAWARQHAQAFNETFWDEAGGCLFPAITPEGPRAGFSLSQLLAIGLSPALLSPERAARLLARAESLFTPLGLREGPDSARVETAWLGTFHAARFRVLGRDAATHLRVKRDLETLRIQLDATAVDHVPAAFEPVTEPARRGRKAPPAAPDRWRPCGVSTVAAADLLRVWIEEVEHSETPSPALAE